jgi:protocatechuate 3,4-dioxygenase beta subunit
MSLRRRTLAALAAGAAASALPWPSRAAAPRGTPVPTAPQTTGPFYPVDWSGDVDNDLVVVRGESARALGRVAHLRGRVLDRDGRPLSGSIVEIWQCDANGRYRHPGDRGGASRDRGFQGRGRTRAGDDGAYAFRTIRPVPYPGRTPHIHVAVWAPDGTQLVTQLYVAGEAANERDALYNAIRDPRRRDSVTARFEPADRIEPGALVADFDLVLG